MAQINPTVGDIVGNTALIRALIRDARKAKADLVAFPELAITGYPPEDLLFKPRFIEDTRRALTALMSEAHGLVVVVGYVGREATGASAPGASAFSPAGRHDLYNAAAVLCERRLVANYCKRLLPNYGVFDESRYFRPGTRLPLGSTFARISGFPKDRPVRRRQRVPR
jgi:NAD+ synthase (glutamine-hydrolysing)